MKDNINVFLHYGYLPDPDVPIPGALQLWFNGSLAGFDYSSTSKSELIKIGAVALKNSFKEEISTDHNKVHIIPLSGGLDSRTILANLLEYLDTSQIITTTFGVPGAPDYETAKSIAKKTGVKWEGIDLSPGKWKWNTDLLINAAKLSNGPTWLFDTAVNYAIHLKFGEDCVYWSGFMGDCLGQIRPGFHDKIKTWEGAKAEFIKKHSISKKYRLSNPNYNPEDCLPIQSYAHWSKLNYYSQISFCIRQQCLTKNIYSPKGYDIRYPFLNPKWVKFILSVPNHYHNRQYLYRKILQSSWPNLFNKWNSPFRNSSKLETLIHQKNANYLIKCLKKIFPNLTSKIPLKNVNYLDWNYALRYQDDFKNVVYSNLQDLKARKIIDWLDINRLWSAHQYIKIDLSSELITLAALEIHLKAKTISLNE